jgi:lactoylglutathione lyase
MPSLRPEVRTVSRVQLALNVPDLDEAVDFYTKLFATEPSKRKPGYANFAIADPPLKLVLFEAPGATARLNHVGVEVESSDDVASHEARLASSGLVPVEENGTCCFAKQDKVWVDGPDGAWEIYTVLEDADGFGEASAHAPSPRDLLNCDTAPEASARCCT